MFLLTVPVFSADLALVPYPKKIETVDGQFALTGSLELRVPVQEQKRLEPILTEELKRAKLPLPKVVPVETDEPQLILCRANTGLNITVPKIPDLPAKAGEGKSDPGEAYSLSVTKDGIVCRGGASRGLYYAVQTLRQLIRANLTDGTLPCLEIKDEPSLKWRCWMDDITRGPSPKIEPWLKQIALGSEFKHNLFTYYMQNQFEYKKHPKIYPHDGSLSQEDLQTAVQFAKEHNLDILGCQQSFSHSRNILSVPEYKHLGESGYILSPTSDKVAPFLDSLYAELFPLVPFEMFNVCCDETWDLAKEKPESVELAKTIGVGGVYMQHILRVYELVKKRNKRMMMWGDIIIKYPEEIKKLPKDVVMLCWWYYEPCTIEKYEAWIKPFSESGYDFFVCPGQSNWSRMLPELSQYVPNIQKFVEAGLKHGTIGMLNTGWEDDGESLHGYNWHAIAWGAECAWNASKTDYKDFNRRIGAVLFGVQNEDFAKAMDIVQELQTKYGLVGNDVFWRRDFVPANSVKAPNPEVIVNLSNQAIDLLEQVKKKAVSNQELLDSSLLGLRRMRLIADRRLDGLEIARRYKTLRTWNPADVQQKQSIVHELDLIEQRIDRNRKAHSALKDEFVRIWNTESKPYSLDRVTKKYDDYDQHFADLKKQVQTVRTDFIKNDTDTPLPVLDFLQTDWERKLTPDKVLQETLNPQSRWLCANSPMRIGFTVKTGEPELLWIPVEQNLSIPETYRNQSVQAFLIRENGDVQPIAAQLNEAETTNKTENQNRLILLVPKNSQEAKIHVYFGLEKESPISGAVTTTDGTNGSKWIENDRIKILLGTEGGHIYKWLLKDADHVDLTDRGENSYHGFSDINGEIRSAKFELRCLNSGSAMVRYGCYRDGELFKTVTVYAGLPLVEVLLSGATDYYWDFDSPENFVPSRNQGTFLFSNGKTDSSPVQDKQVREKNVFWGLKSNAASQILGLITPEEASTFVIGPGGLQGGVGIESSPLRSHFITYAGQLSAFPGNKTPEKMMNELRAMFNLKQHPVIVRYAPEKAKENF
jgi:hypothetical protein